MSWDTPEEAEIYRESIHACLAEPRILRRLEARPEVTLSAVLDAMNRTNNVNAALRSCRDAYYAYRVVYDKMVHGGERFFDLLDDWEWDWRTFSFYGAALLTLILWFGGAPFLYTLLLLLVWCVGTLVLALRDSSSRGQLRRWARMSFHGLQFLVMWPVVWVFGRLWASQLTSEGTGPVMVRVIEELLGEDHDSLLLPDSYDGLRTRGGPEHLVKNSATQQLKRKIEQIDGGTIAVSGSRGSGKTTLLENCAGDDDFCVFAHAPATYAPHDFLTSLFVKVCEEYISREGYDVPEFLRLPHGHRILRRAVMLLRRLTHWLSYALPAAGLIGLGLFASIRTLQAEHGSDVQQQIAELTNDVRVHVMDIWDGRATGPALALVGSGILLWMLRQSAVTTRVMRKTRRVLFGLLVIALQWGPIASLAFDPDIRYQAGLLVSQEDAGGWIMVLAMVWMFCLYQFGANWKGPLRVGRWVLRRRHVFGAPVRLIPLTALAILLSAAPGRVLVTDSQNLIRVSIWLLGIMLGKLRYRSWSIMRPEPKLVTECRNHLYRLQTVQSSSAAVNTGAAQFLSLGTSHTTSLSTIPPNYPELVGDFRELLTRIADYLHHRGERVVIAIDEVDRLGSDEQALAFLREVKAILGVPHVHYLISVAEDVGAAFVRRGLPHRDATDSSLDDVVHVQPCVLAESGAILKKRAPGISDPYIFLAHSLSGGLPRDLIRYGRRLMEIQQATAHLELTDISRVMIVEELSETLAGFRTLLAKQQWSSENSLILGSFRSLVGHLRTACPCPHREEQLLQALEYFAIYTARAHTQPDASSIPGEARVLIDEAAAYAYFSYTLLGIFGREGFNRRRTQAAACGPDGDPELLAEARLELAVSPYSARSLIDGIRLAWDLTRDHMVAATAVPLPPPRSTGCPRHPRSSMP
ncbi:P-loop NTPase fold protein [Streptomyces viridochromogenes]|uniref:P-loop NTPase fold protein n=1 Tax=Streptomyces viridochromogenes TaxID=1938 RepID=UPI00069ED8F2|nr:P-loop NTPase fold protein [Streptomyces viridochromogenes]